MQEEELLVKIFFLNSEARKHLIYSFYKHVDLLCFFLEAVFQISTGQDGKS